MQEFRDRVAVVTGGASGIGKALAKAFLGEGMKVVIADVEEPALKATADELASAGAVSALKSMLQKQAAMDAKEASLFAQLTTKKKVAVHKEAAAKQAKHSAKTARCVLRRLQRALLSRGAGGRGKPRAARRVRCGRLPPPDPLACRLRPPARATAMRSRS